MKRNVKLDDNFIITLDLLNKWNACGSWINYFENNYPTEGIHFKDLLALPKNEYEINFINFVFEIIFKECCCNATLIPSFKNFLDNLSFNFLNYICLPIDDDTCFSPSDEDIEYLLVSFGECVKFSSSQKYVRFASFGEMAKVASSNNRTRVISLGDDSNIALSGNRSNVASSGKNVQIAICGYSTHVKTSGDNATIVATNIMSSVSSKGNNARIATLGIGSVVTLGKNGCASLTWYDEKKKRYRFTVIYEGENGIKAGVPYTLDENGVVIEAEVNTNA